MDVLQKEGSINLFGPIRSKIVKHLSLFLHQCTFTMK